MSGHAGSGDAADLPWPLDGDDDPASMINLKADFHGHVIDYVCDQDRAFFAAHPEVQAFERPAFPHEFCDLLAGGGPRVCFDFEGVVVRVTRMVDGVRARQPLWAGMILPLIPPRW